MPCSHELGCQCHVLCASGTFSIVNRMQTSENHTGMGIAGNFNGKAPRFSSEIAVAGGHVEEDGDFHLCPWLG